jgi:hydroxymethylglutaryl-CoA lyase
MAPANSSTASVAFGCPFGGAVPVATVTDDVKRSADLEVSRVTLGETTGMATPHSVSELFGRLKRDVAHNAHRAVRAMRPSSR